MIYFGIVVGAVATFTIGWWLGRIVYRTMRND
jgi:hypothetical protein